MANVRQSGALRGIAAETISTLIERCGRATGALQVRARAAVTAAASLLLAACATPPAPPPVSMVEPPPVIVQPPTPPRPAPKIGLALGGGAAKGFAHIGVIKALEAQGIVPDIVVGTSAGSVVGAMYAAGKNGFELQELAMQMEKSQVVDWSIFARGGMIKGEALQQFINKAVGNKPIEKLGKTFGAVATDLGSGDPILFRVGDTGMAVRASASVPGVFQPVQIAGREYVDGGLVSPVPAKFARALGAELVIAVDISDKPNGKKPDNVLDVLMQTFNIMGYTISQHELPQADVVIRPDIRNLSSTDLVTQQRAVLEGEKAAAKVMPDIKTRLARLREPR